MAGKLTDGSQAFLKFLPLAGREHHLVGYAKGASVA
jgi:hypothetical protein